MVTYDYPQIAGSLIILALKIERQVGILPSGWGNASGSTFVNFDSALTVAQKNALDTLMASPNAGEIPPNAGTKFNLKDIMTHRAEFQTTLGAGVNFLIFPVGQLGYRLLFNSVLTNAQKNQVRSAWTDLFTEV